MAFQEKVRWGCQYLKSGSNNWLTLTSAIFCWPKQITELTQMQGEGIYTPLLHGRAENLWQHLICHSTFFDHWLFTFLCRLSFSFEFLLTLGLASLLCFILSHSISQTWMVPGCLLVIRSETLKDYGDAPCGWASLQGNRAQTWSLGWGTCKPAH